MEYFVYYDGGYAWMEVKSFGDSKDKAYKFIKDKIKRDPEKRHIKGSEFLNMMHEDHKEKNFDGPVLIFCDCDEEFENKSYKELCVVLMSSK